MTHFAAFALSLGGQLALMMIIAGWLFRTAAAPLWAKLAVPSLSVALACWTPFSVAAMLGYPVWSSAAGLPERAELIAFAPDDAAGTVDLWLRAGDVPRSYETKLDAAMKQTLRLAQGELMAGRPAMLKKKGKGKGSGTGDKAGAGSSPAGDRFGIGGDEDLYILDPSAITALPPKE